jgi:GTPase SAR1 family protein
MAASLKASREGLEMVERARWQKGWNKTADAWCDAALTSKATLKRFWAQQPIQEETFIRICRAVGLERWQDIAEDRFNESDTLNSVRTDDLKESKISSRLKENIKVVLPEKLPPIRYFVGRERELETLKSQILTPDGQANPMTAICIVGLSGIGKTTLTSQLVRHLQSENSPFVAIAWESLQSATGKAPKFEGIIDSLLFTLSRGDITTAITAQDDYYQKTERLIKLLRDQPCLVVIDNVETVLKTRQAEGVGYFADDCIEYAWLFRQLVETEHQSKIIFTSRESLADLPRLQTYTLYLAGLEQAAAVDLLRLFHLIATQDELVTLVERYQGHPKVLELVAALIWDDKEFQGQVGRFLQDREWLLIRDIERLIDEGVVRLSEPERTCLKLISVYQNSDYPLSYAAIAAQMPAVSEYDLKEKIILGLKRRQLLDYDPQQKSYQLHPLVQEKAYRVLCQDPAALRIAHQQAHDYFMQILLTQET